MDVTEELIIRCSYLDETDCGFACRLAALSSNKTLVITSLELCEMCDVGKVQREIKCNDVGGNVFIVGEYSAGGVLYLYMINSIPYCKKRKTQTDLDYCKSCNSVTALATKNIVNNVTGLFSSLGFSSSKVHLELVYNKINKEHDYDGAIREATVSLEGVLAGVLEMINVEPVDKTVTGLYSDVKKRLHFGDESSSQHLMKVVGSISGAVTGLGAMRNELSDAHGKGMGTPELYESYAELALNLSATMSTFVIRRYKEAHHNQ